MSVKHAVMIKNNEREVLPWDPFREMSGFAPMMPRWLFGAQRMDPVLPAINVQETDKEYVLKADIPGTDKKDVHVDVKNGVMTIRGEKKTEKEEKGKNFLRHERYEGSFSRAFTLPEDVKAGDIKAVCKDGVLEVKMPRVAGAKRGTCEVKVQ